METGKDEEDERREAALAAGSLFQSDFKSSRVTEVQLRKLKELHKKRLQIKEKSKGKLCKTANGPPDVLNAGGSKAINANEMEDSKLSTEKKNTSADGKTPTLLSRKRKKLHWGWAKTSTGNLNMERALRRLRDLFGE